MKQPHSPRNKLWRHIADIFSHFEIRSVPGFLIFCRLLYRDVKGVDNSWVHFESPSVLEGSAQWSLLYKEKYWEQRKRNPLTHLALWDRKTFSISSYKEIVNDVSICPKTKWIRCAKSDSNSSLPNVNTQNQIWGLNKSNTLVCILKGAAGLFSIHITDAVPKLARVWGAKRKW